MSRPDYSDKNDAYFSQGRPEMTAFVPARASRILEVGCGRGDFIARLKATRTFHATGVEPFADAAAAARVHFDVVHEATVDAAFDTMQGQSFDCVVFNDVLEHMVDPWQVLRNVHGMLDDDGCVVASIPSIRYWPVLNGLFLHGDFSYVESGVLDRTHLRFFTRRSMTDMFNTCDYAIERIEGINAGSLGWKIALLNSLTSGRFDDTRYPQFAIVARKAA